MFLLIESKGVAPIEAFTLLGASTARGSDGLIGQFGTGSKHAVTLLLRERIPPVIFCGQEKLEFSTEAVSLGDKTFDRVLCNRLPLGFVTDFGAIDWTSVDMALREFVSNALDSAGVDGTKVILTERAEALDGYTRIYVPISPDVIGFYSRLDKWFLHFKHKDLLAATVLDKAGRNFEAAATGACVYRRGVRVREVVEVKSVFDYNLNDLPIDEVRKSDDSTIKSAAGFAMQHASPQQLAAVMESFREYIPNEGYTVFEHDFCSWHMLGNDTWVAAFYEVYGENAVIAQSHTVDKVRAKGYVPVLVPGGWKSELVRSGVRTDKSVLGEDVLRGIETGSYVCAQVTREIRRIWAKVASVGMLNGAVIPTGKQFALSMNAEKQILGFYREGVIFINRDIVGESVQFTVTVLEEIAHHITGAADESRDFQDWLLNLAVRLGGLKNEGSL